MRIDTDSSETPTITPHLDQYLTAKLNLITATFPTITNKKDSFVLGKMFEKFSQYMYDQAQE